MCYYCQFFKSINFHIEYLNNFNKIYVLVSGGIDSTLLAEFVSFHYPKKTYFVNCYNPFEGSKTLNVIKKNPNFIEIKTQENLKYGQILKESFLSIPLARARLKKGNYDKGIFACCQKIKHSEFKKNKLFLEENTVILSGIKAGDGKQRAYFLKDIRRGSHPSMEKKGLIRDQPTFFWKHNNGFLYCYPFRDYFKRELPDKLIAHLKTNYPDLSHSACCLCPIVVLFDLKNSGNYEKSIRYWNKISGQKLLEDYNEQM